MNPSLGRAGDLQGLLNTSPSTIPKLGAQVRVLLRGPLLFRYEFCSFSDCNCQLLSSNGEFDSSPVNFTSSIKHEVLRASLPGGLDRKEDKGLWKY